MKERAATIPWLAIGLAFAILLDTAGQLLWKICIASIPPGVGVESTISAVLHQPLFIALVATFLCQLFNWLKVLKRADLSYAQPITSLSYVTVCALSAILLGDHIGIAKAIGILSVLGGVALVSQSKPLSRPDPGELR